MEILAIAVLVFMALLIYVKRVGDSLPGLFGRVLRVVKSPRLSAAISRFLRIAELRKVLANPRLASFQLKMNDLLLSHRILGTCVGFSVIFTFIFIFSSVMSIFGMPFIDSTAGLVFHSIMWTIILVVSGRRSEPKN